jgi:hypothetical protein
MTDDEAVREYAMASAGGKVGRFQLRSITAADISFMERAGVSKDIPGKNFGDHYKVHAAAYILTHNPKQISRELFDLQEFIANVDEWVMDKDVTRDEFVKLANAVLKMNGDWYKSSTESESSGSGN